MLKTISVPHFFIGDISPLKTDRMSILLLYIFDYTMPVMKLENVYCNDNFAVSLLEGTSEF